jgi:hypothetical protein
LRMLRRIDSEEERERIVERVLPRIHHLTGRIELIDMVGNLENAGHELVSAAESDRLYNGLVTELQDATPVDLSNERGLVQLFVRLIAKDQPDHGISVVREKSRDDRVLLQLLRAGLGETRSQTMGDYAVHSSPSLPWELYEEWFGADELRERLATLAAGTNLEELPSRTLAALEAATRYASGELSNERFRMAD